MAYGVGAPTREFPKTKETVVTQTQVKAGSRLLYVDNLRVFMTILVVLHHLAITYGAAGSWAYNERPSTLLTEILLTVFTALNQGYFMGLFFLIAGYFVPGTVDRKGSVRFLKDRLIRLGIPLLVYGLLISPVVEYVKGITEGWWTGSLWGFVLQYWREGMFAPGPLWFVETLLVFSLVYVLGRAGLAWLQRRWGLSSTRLQPRPLSHRWILAYILIMIPASFLIRLYLPIGTEWNHLQLAYFPQYILLFTGGILAYRMNWLAEIPAGMRKVWSITAVVAALSLPFFLILLGAVENFDLFMGGPTMQSLVTVAWEAVYSIAMVILMLAVFQRRFDFQGQVSRLMSRNAYAVYIIHAPLIIALALIMRNVTVYPLLKFALLALPAVAICFLVSETIVRRIPLADRVL